ncbi:MAG: hypothetical protein A2Z52_01155 [Candidatus Moranbacteria bacterium RBG_19FT_COMBO_42_6]|nr:MAG: hypothetical protein A2Z52_01155 [Candidatus Moranbacteria bacterium RBG_19FT_COMBO_42_6]
MKKFRFIEWKVYKDSQDLFKLILRIVKDLPREYRFELGSQLNRAALSVILNIAEGSGKTSDKELMRFLDISLGSAYEVLASVDVLRNNGLMDAEEFDLVYNKVSDISDQLGGFKQKIKKENGL